MNKREYERVLLLIICLEEDVVTISRNDFDNFGEDGWYPEWNWKGSK